MKLKELRDAYQEATGMASSLTRNTSYSLIALCWILCGQRPEALANFKLVLLLLVLSLSADFFQYIVRSITIWITYKYRECQTTAKNCINMDDVEVSDYPGCLPVITGILFLAKLLFTISAAIVLAIKIFRWV